MDTTLLREIRRIQGLSVNELQAEWLKLHGEPTRSRNRTYLWRRLAWRVQELARGGLSDRARTRIEELAPNGFQRARVPDVAALSANPAPVAEATAKVTRIRNPHQPAPGTVLTRQYHGREIRVVTLDDGSFEWDDRVFSSLSAVARAVTGAKWNGRLFFGITKRKRRA